jgi:hypothetical protein
VPQLCPIEFVTHDKKPQSPLGNKLLLVVMMATIIPQVAAAAALMEDANI